MKKINDLAKFPEENPNPILRIDRRGVLLYANKSSSPLLRAWRLAVDKKVTKKWIYVVKKSLKEMRRGEIIENANKKIFLFIAVPVKNEYVNFYGYDNTERKKTEEALRISEEKYKDVVDSQTELICRLLPSNGRITFVNKAYADFYGKKPDQLIGTTYKKHVPADDYRKDIAHMRSLNPKNPTKVIEHRVIKPDGEIGWQRWNDTGIFDKDGKLIEVQSIGVDITERKQNEEALHENKERLEVALNSGKMGMWEWRANSKYSFWSTGEYKLLGLPPGDGNVSNDFFFKYVHSEDLLNVKKLMDRAIKTGRHFDHEFRVIRADDKTRWLKCTGVVCRDKKGKTKSILGINYDITERKNFEEKLKEIKKDLDRAQTVTKVGSWRLDTRKNELLWSDENYRIFGVPKGTPQTYESFLAIVHPDDREYVDKKWKAGLEGEPYDIQHRIIVGRQIRWVREKAYLEFDNTGNLLGGFGITQDITKQKEIDQAKTEFISMASHQLRTPLASIKLAAEMLSNHLEEVSCSGDRKNVCCDYVGSIDDDIQKMTKLIDRLLNISRLDMGTLMINPEALPLNQTVAEIIHKMVPQMKKKGLKAKTKYDKNLNGKTKIDRTILKNVLQILLSNAIKLTPKGGDIAISTARNSKDVQIKVADTGPGVSEKLKPKLFTKLFRSYELLDKENSAQSAGLGLYIAKSMIEQAGGKIWLEDAPPGKKGAVFVFSIPLAGMKKTGNNTRD